jgi:hypothetical protein
MGVSEMMRMPPGTSSNIEGKVVACRSVVHKLTLNLNYSDQMPVQVVRVWDFYKFDRSAEVFDPLRRFLAQEFTRRFPAFKPSFMQENQCILSGMGQNASEIQSHIPEVPVKIYQCKVDLGQAMAFVINEELLAGEIVASGDLL